MGVVFISLITLNCKNDKTSTNEQAMVLNKKEQKFEWLPTECAPEAYPIEIVNGTFSLDNKIIASIPSGGRTVKNGWGKQGSMYVVGPDFKTVPNQLNITWISFTENKFYKGSFDLPQDKMLDLFNKGFIDRLDRKVTYSGIVCGMAPGGIVSVWLLGGGKITEIDHYKAQEIDLTMKEFNPSGIQDREKYVKDALNSLKDEAKIHLQKEGITFGKWTEFRKRYNWKPILKQEKEKSFLKVFIDYVNGEHIFSIGTNPELKEFQSLALPKYAKLYWEDKNKNVYGSKLYFDEDEVKKAFETIDNSSVNKKIEVLFKVDKYNGNMEISLKSDTDSIKLQKTKIKIFETTK